MFEERSVAVALPESTILGAYVHELSQDDSVMDCHTGITDEFAGKAVDNRTKELVVPIDLHNGNGIKKRKSFTEEGASSFKAICGSPSFSEMSHNTTVDDIEMNSAPRPESKLGGILSVGGSGGSGRRGSRKGLGLVFSLDSRASASPMSSNGTDNSSVEGDGMAVAADESAAVALKMEVSYSPVPPSAVKHIAASEEASLLMELAESGRKSARSSSFYASDPVDGLTNCGGSPTVAQLAAAAAAAAAPIATADEQGDSTLSNLLLLRNMPTASLGSPVMTRQRSSTFSAASTYPLKARYMAAGGGGRDLSVLSPSSKTPMAALTWLASMEDETLAVANSLFELSGAFSLPSSAYKADRGEEYYYSDGDDSALEPYSHHNMELLLPGEEQLPGLRRSAKLSHKGVAVPMSANSNIVHRNANGSVSGVGRARSYSMTHFDRSAVSNTHQLIGQHSIRGAGRSSDPLSKALKKFSDKGNMLSGGGLGEGYIGIYSPEDRKERIRRFLEKRKQRMWTKKVKYDVRKNFADSRVRVKGRFVKKEEEEGATPPANAANRSKKMGKAVAAAAAAEEEEEEEDYYSD